MSKKAFAALALYALILPGMMPQPGSAREPNAIFGPIIERYKTITNTRKKLRSREKKGEQLTGDEYYALAFSCTYDEPKSQSIILTELGRSRCKDLVIDYYLEAGRRGTPEGFLAAAKAETAPADAFGFAQLAYQFSGEDAALRDAALALLADLQPRAGATDQVNAYAVQISQQLVAGGRYPGARNPAGPEEWANISPQLNWLNFSNPKRCGWSETANRIFENAVGFDEMKTYSTIPATVRIPGIAKPVTSRITRPDKSAPGVVTYYLDFKGRWNGLTVLGLTDTFFEESHGVDGTGIRFAEPVEVVAAKLARLGFVVNPKGGNRNQIERRDSDGNFDGVTTFIGRKNGETVFLCDEVFWASYGA